MPVILEFSHREYKTLLAEASGVPATLPVILTEHGVLEQYAKYMHLNRFKIRSWQDSSTFALQLLLEYREANKIFTTLQGRYSRRFMRQIHAMNSYSFRCASSIIIAFT
ncbi:phage integrase family protein [Pseudomonas amygdali pv. mori str. 301020]|uniref:Phage integrase protein n=2 Tax=Pseudomonas amygdali pv. mori TaxID=34065 RepID=A0A3M5J0V2_PSEA0|nr:hypothetical protein [Pseudomonas amygdali]EGH22808.1 phage integrase family protein [Pseudomonas amygdali pv. mori str. 301020]RMT16434.1 Phage integrase protein [Pseudomonas amygdali pv. mori]